MRLVTFDAGDGPRAGLLGDERVLDAWAAVGEPHRGSLRELIAAGRVEELRAARGDRGAPSHPLSAVELLPPIPDPEKIVCIGLNYGKHAAEGGFEPPAAPTIFAKYRNALAPPGAAVTLPANSRKVDYEAEVAFVVGRRARDVPEDEALDHVAGYTLLNDLSARDLQFSTPQWMSGKVFDGSAPCGPALVTPEEAGPADAIGIRLTLNGAEMQSATTEDLIFSVPRLLSHLSGLMTLEPGDIVSTGTPEGVGSVREPRVWLQDGDEVAIESPTLGRLETRLVVVPQDVPNASHRRAVAES
ncbi:MAG TPA: fumarylacetoacetate hydrolase family protein [Solirubrobacterales bacterium]|jgi:2-keto-4-pentenoate hydratase/2-oxohepta-3-ene-1,7-dioic acid hydratase in catechol pathway|nr:fumarylacetoacetate hydrolase family protein [Solirubrobacterales bacterium]